jgi:hypothetical protein
MHSAVVEREERRRTAKKDRAAEEHDQWQQIDDEQKHWRQTAREREKKGLPTASRAFVERQQARQEQARRFEAVARKKQ